MSLSGTVYGAFSGTTTAKARPLMTWSGVQSIAGNYTDVTVNFKFWQASSTYWSYNINASGSSSHLNTVNINGDTVGGQKTTPYDTRNTSGNLTLRSHTVRVYHNADGTKTCWIGWSGDTNVARGTYNFGETVTLDTIPRRATVNTNANLTIGNNLAYTLTNNGSLYVRMEYWILGNGGWYWVKNQNNGTGTSGTFTMSSVDNEAMYSRMPSVTSASAIVRAYTYSDAGYSVQVGDYHDMGGTVSINQTTNKPVFTDYTVGNLDKNINVVDKYSNALVTSSTSTLLGSNSKMIKGYSKLRAVITSANKMVAQNYATNVKYRFVAGALQREENYSADSTVNLDIDNAVAKDVSVTAIDSRNLTTAVNKSLDYMAEYVPVSLWGLTFERDNGVDSETKLIINGSYWKQYFGGGTSGVLNSITAHWRYKETTESWDSQTWTAITLTDTDGSLSYDDYVNGDLGVGGFDSEKSFDIEVRVFDKLTATIVESTLSVGTPVMDITSSGVSLMGKYDADEGGALQVLSKNVLMTGWYPATETWTYDAVNRFKISGDYTGIYQVGDKIKLTQTTVKYFRITAISYSSPNTTVTVEAFNLYALASATITDTYFSRIENPFGFPLKEKLLFNGTPARTVTLSESYVYFKQLHIFYAEGSGRYNTYLLVGSNASLVTTTQGYFDGAYRIRTGAGAFSMLDGTTLSVGGSGSNYSTDTTSTSVVSFSDVKILPVIVQVIGIRW